jgi:hypothetical protein
MQTGQQDHVPDQCAAGAGADHPNLVGCLLYIGPAVTWQLQLLSSDSDVAVSGA